MPPKLDNTFSNTTPFADRREYAIDIALRVGHFLKSHRETHTGPIWHTKTNYKIQLDCTSDSIIREKIMDRYKFDNIFSEEDSPYKQPSNISWVIDPLDGTIPYHQKTSDHYCVSIGIAQGNKPIVGVIYIPEREELLVAEEGEGAFCNYQPLRVSMQTDINHIIMGGPDGGKETNSFERTRITDFQNALLGKSGIACPLSFAGGATSMSMVAQGKLDAYIALSQEPYDMAAAVPIMREAGAQVTNLLGEQWTLTDPSILAANPQLHPKIFSMIKGLYIPEK